MRSPQLPLQLAGDISDYGVGAVTLCAYPDDSNNHFFMFHVRYQVVNGIMLTGEGNFHSYLYGHKYTIYCDNKLLTTILLSSDFNDGQLF